MADGQRRQNGGRKDGSAHVYPPVVQSVYVCAPRYPGRVMGPNSGKIKARIAAPGCTSGSNRGEWLLSWAIPFLQMLDQKPASAALDRRTVATFLQRAIAAAEALPRAGLHRRLAAPAGIPLELWFDDIGQADLAAARLADARPDDERTPRTRLYTLNGASLGFDQLPFWGDAACDAAEFHAILAEAGLRAAY